MLRASEIVISSQPCEGAPPAQAVPLVGHASGVTTPSVANPRRGAWTSQHWLVGMLRASEIIISSQPCEGDSPAQAVPLVGHASGVTTLTAAEFAFL